LCSCIDARVLGAKKEEDLRAASGCDDDDDKQVTSCIFHFPIYATLKCYMACATVSIKKKSRRSLFRKDSMLAAFGRTVAYVND